MSPCVNRTARLLAVLALLLILLAVTPARALKPAAAQGTINLETVAIDIWPEYDQPSVLVMYNITLSSDVKLPTSLSISIPASAGQPHAVATKDTNGMYNLQYETVPAGEWTRITFTASMPELRIEYYDPSLAKQNNERRFTFRWPGDYPVKNLIIHVQQPAKATNMKFSQNLGSGMAGQDGLTYFTLMAGAQDAGKEYQLDISYLKPDDSLTNPGSFQPAWPSQKVDEQTPGRVTLNEILPWSLGGLGALLIGVGIWWYWRAGRRAEPAPTRARHHPARTDSASAGAVTSGKSEGVYCHQCGRRAAAGDVYCRACGTKLRY